MSKYLAYVDADVIMHRAAAMSDQEFDGEPMMDVSQAEAHFDGMLGDWLKPLGNPEYKLCFSVGRNFRKEIYPLYKAQRPEHAPILAPLKDRLLDRAESLFVPGIEADDIIGMAASGDKNVIAVSVDKDFMTIPGRVFFPGPNSKPFVVKENEADFNWMVQTMIGDVIDNYKGIPGVGPVRAKKMIHPSESLKTMWKKVVSLFQMKGVPVEEALTMARLARILRAGEYDYENNEPVLWTPPT